MSASQPLYAFALEREAKPFRRRCPHARVVVIGAGPIQAADSISMAVAGKRPAAVVIAGFAGALSNDLKVGDIVVATEVVYVKSGAVFTPTYLSCGKGNFRSGRLLTVDGIVGQPSEKRALAKCHDAIAVDMESAVVGRVCEAQGIPWAAVRVISDSVDTEMSPELIDVLSSGEVSIRRTLGTVIRKPSLLVEFRRLARDTRSAAERLADFLVGWPS
jgi:nucleoside phosphorylase